MLTTKIFGDASDRTKLIAKYAYQLIISAVIFTIAFIMFIGGSFKYASTLKKTSTPIGARMTFARSEASVSLKDIYTDKSGKVLIARIGTTDEANTLLPFRGTDYKVYVSAKSLDGKSKAQVIFGKLSTDGDMFVIIPNPSNDVYSIYISNTKFIAAPKLSTDSSAASAADKVGATIDNATSGDGLQASSISKALSDYQYNSVENAKNASTTDAYKIKDDNADAITFRVTKSPQFKTDAFKVKVVNADLVTADNKFDFETMFNKIFKDSASKQLVDAHDKLSANIKALKTYITELEDRLKENPDDNTAKTALESANLQMDDKRKQSDELAKRLATYNGLKYEDNYFTNLQTSATVIQSKAVK